MPDQAEKSSNRLLDPIARISEVLFGLIMVLTFTGSFSVAEADRQETRTMLIGALGCNLAWGIVDAIMYLMSNLTTRAHGVATLRMLHKTTDPKVAYQGIADALPPIVASILDDRDLETMRQRLMQLPDPKRYRKVNKDDWLGALGVFLLVFLSTFPVVIPFMLTDKAPLAMRLSNGVAIVMLFCCGYSLGRFAGTKPWLVGLVLVFVGMFLAGMTLALGG